MVRYADKRFSAHEAMLAGYNFARLRDYETVILVGASLGGELALRFVEHARTESYTPVIKMIACDVPLGGRHLPQPLAAQKLAKYIHIGPVFNLLSPLVTRLVFKKLTTEQSAALATQPPFTNVSGIPTVYLQCESDDVIKGFEAFDEWQALLGTSLLGETIVDGGHVQFVENHNPWYDAHAWALSLFGYVVR